LRSRSGGRRTECHPDDMVIVPHDRADRLACGDVPEPCRLVLARGGDRLASDCIRRNSPTFMGEYIACFGVPLVPGCQVGSAIAAMQVIGLARHPQRLEGQSKPTPISPFSQAARPRSRSSRARRLVTRPAFPCSFVPASRRTLRFEEFGRMPRLPPGINQREHGHRSSAVAARPMKTPAACSACTTALAAQPARLAAPDWRSSTNLRRSSARAPAVAYRNEDRERPPWPRLSPGRAARLEQLLQSLGLLVQHRS